MLKNGDKLKIIKTLFSSYFLIFIKICISNFFHVYISCITLCAKKKSILLLYNEKNYLVVDL